MNVLIIIIIIIIIKCFWTLLSTCFWYGFFYYIPAFFLFILMPFGKMFLFYKWRCGSVILFLLYPICFRFHCFCLIECCTRFSGWNEANKYNIIWVLKCTFAHPHSLFSYSILLPHHLRWFPLFIQWTNKNHLAEVAKAQMIHNITFIILRQPFQKIEHENIFNFRFEVFPMI